MNKQLSLYSKGQSRTPKRFKFVLSSNGTDLTLRYAPKGWADGELTFIRDKFYKGVFESYSTSELTFVKDGRDFIQTAYETAGIDHEVTINIYILNNATFQYQIYFAGKLDLSTYKIDSIGVTCEVIPAGFQNVVLNRDEIDVDMMSTKSIGGTDGDTPALSTVWEKVTIPEYQATANVDWLMSGNTTAPGSSSQTTYMPMVLSYSEYIETEIFEQTMEIFPSTPANKFFKSAIDRTLTMYINVVVDLTSEPTSATFSAFLNIFKNGTILHTFSPAKTETADTSAIFTFAVNQALYMTAGDEYALTLTTTGTSDYDISILNGVTSFVEQLGETLQSVDVPMFYIYEAFARTLQLISGSSTPFYSKILGRTDSVPDSYATDGIASLIAITNGKWIREFSPNASQLNFNLKDLFTSINALHNIGLGFETISGSLKVRIEQEAYFFDINENPNYPAESQIYQTNQILDLSSDLTNEMISKEVLPDWYANEIECGYGTFEYENVQGLKEFNTKSNWATPIKSVKSKLNLVSPYRADTQGVNKLREKPVETFPTEDVSGDNDVFMFDVKRDGDYVFTVKTWDDFDYVSGGVDPQSSYNLNFSPRRNLERHGNRITSMKLKSTDEIQWLKSDKNNSLVTQRDDETEPKAENGDILVNTLTPGYWIPEAYIFEAPVTLETITAIQANPRGVIKIGVGKYGWILDIQTNNEKKKGTFKLLRVDTSKVKVIAVPLVGLGIGSAVIGTSLIVAENNDYLTSDLDISDLNFASDEIDAYLIYHAFTLLTNNTTIDIRGNNNPTSASAAARQELFDNYVLVNYNSGYTP